MILHNLYIIHRLLSAMARVFLKFPSHDTVLNLALQTMPLCAPFLPKQSPPIITELHMNALETFSHYDFETNPSFIMPAFKFILILWGKYSSSLPASSNTKHLAKLIITALKPDLGRNEQTRVQEAITCGKDFILHMMRFLSDSQILALEKEGVYEQFRSLIMHYDKIPVEDLKEIVIGVGMFAEIKPSPMSFLEENYYLGFIHSALKHPSAEAVQTLIWQLFSVLCKQEKKFAEGLFEVNILESISTLIQMENADLMPSISFLSTCCHVSPSVCISACINDNSFMSHLLSVLRNVSHDEEKLRIETIVCLCDFFATLCRSEPAHLATILELKIVSHLEDCARVYPNECLLHACIAIEGLVNSFPPNQTSNVSPSMKKVIELFKPQRTEYCSQNHLQFFQDMLSNPVISANQKFLKLMYITFQKILKPLTEEAMEKVYTKDFMEFYSVCFIRDTCTFPNLMSRIVFSTHYFVFEMRSKDPVSILNELNFHDTVANLLQSSTSTENISVITGLLACMVGKYYEFLKDVKPFVKAQVPNTLLDKAKICGQPGRRVQFSDDFGRIMLNLTADKELSLELYTQGYLESLIEMITGKRMVDIRRSMIHAVGNIALCGQNIKQVLLDNEFYKVLFSITRMEIKSGGPFLLSACYRVLHILASGDWAKRKFVESGCIDIILQVLRLRKDNPEIRWRPLGLLSSLGFMATSNRRYILTDEVMEVVASILRESTNGKVISYTTLVFLGSDELDEGARKLRELGVVEYLTRAIDNPGYRKQAPDLERWGVHVLEKQNLYTISIPKTTPYPIPPPNPTNESDWPPYIQFDSPMETGSDNTIPIAASSSPTATKLLPLETSFFKSHTPVAPQFQSAVQQLTLLGLDPSKPLFRIGRVYGSTHGLCSNCEGESPSEELVIRPLNMTAEQYQMLVDNGWYRRGGVKMFRLRHNHSVECADWETRVLVNEFDHRTHRSYRKVLRRMPEQLKVETIPAQFHKESFDLYNKYHMGKHDKPLKSEYSYCEHIVNKPIAYQPIDGIEDLQYGTYHQLYWLDGKLVAVGIIDIIPKGMVSIYMWYDVTKEISKYSFGVYSALKEIEMIKKMSEKNPEMKYYYLQGWNRNNKKLDYKANYEPEEFYCPCIVPNWVQSLDGVDRAKKEMISRREEADKKREGENDIEMLENESAPKEEQTSGKENKSQAKNGSAMPNDKESGNGEVKPKIFECDAFPNDEMRYEQDTDHTNIDISKIVICLNYCEYMFLEQLFQRYDIDQNQREIVELRFKELFLALTPDLRSQLIIDMMASETNFLPDTTVAVE